MARPEGLQAFAKRFPALSRLASSGRPRRARIPFVQQATTSDCGAAALAMTLGCFGRHVTLAEMRDAVGWSKDGSSAAAMLDVGRAHGLRGRAVALDLADLHHLPRGSILYWRFNHFVVLESVTERTVVVVDPAFGRRRMPMAELGKLFTGVALAFEAGEGFTPGGVRRSGVWALVKSLLVDSGMSGRILGVSGLLQLLALGLPLLTGLLVDRVLPQEDTDLLFAVTVGLALVLFLHVSATLIRSHLLVHLRTFIDARLSLRFAERVLAAPYGFFHSRPPGDLMMRLNSNSTIREMLTSGALSAVLDGALVLAYVVLLFVISAPLAGVVLFLCVARIVAFLVVQRRSLDLLAENLERMARSQSYEYEFLGAIEVVKAMGLEDRVLGRWSNLFVDTLNVNIRRGRLAAGFETYISALDVASPLLILLFGAHLVLTDSLSLGMMLAVSSLALGILAPLSRLAETAGRLVLIEAYLTRIDDVAGEAGERTGGIRMQHMQGGVELAGVSFRHSTFAPPVIRDLSLTIRPGEHVAVVGRSGCGKSTLGRLLSALYVPQQGTITYDGRDLQTLDLRHLRQQLGVVTQETYLFSGDIRSNIGAADPTMPLERIEWAARMACIHDDIVTMPMGYETMLADRGHSLSGGQRQRLALARSIAHRPAVLLLDEATSALDTILEERVYQNLRRLQATTIIIAHRLSTLLHADKIVVMDQGRIVEIGTHAELIERGGTYAKLYEAQSEGRDGTASPVANARTSTRRTSGREAGPWEAGAGRDSH